jgi:two-component system, chemotaxis family, sensor kinase Cph1
LISYAPGGVTCEITLPHTSVVELADRPLTLPRLEAIKPGPLPNVTVARPRILIVEDSFLVILELEALCGDLGWEVIGPATRLAQALTLARDAEFDAAFLDVNLDGEMSWEIATLLQERHIPFAFSTGYDGARILPDHLKATKIIGKPFRIADVERCIRQLLVDAKPRI